MEKLELIKVIMLGFSILLDFVITGLVISYWVKHRDPIKKQEKKLKSLNAKLEKINAKSKKEVE